MSKTMTGAQMVIRALKDQGVDTIFGYPGGAVLPIYDEIFQQSSHYFEKNLKFIKKHKLGTLLAIGLGSPLHRTLIAAWRLSGQKVVGFSHGNNYALSVEDVYIEHDGLSITPELIVASQGHKLMLQELADEYRHNKKIKMARINFNRKSHYKGLFNQLQKKNAARRIKKIMLIGFPTNSFMYPGTPSNYSLSNYFSFR